MIHVYRESLFIHPTLNQIIFGRFPGSMHALVEGPFRGC